MVSYEMVMCGGLSW